MSAETPSAYTAIIRGLNAVVVGGYFVGMIIRHLFFC
jgi:hypothetical protein